MHSRELAKASGVTVRTLRHYHQIGLLPEPERSANGYRQYTARDLATVLRIVSFTKLGFALHDVRTVINDTLASVQLLDQIDQQASAEIHQLMERRQLIAELKSAGATPDLPPALMPYVALLRRHRRGSSREEIFEREQLALLTRVSDEAGLGWLVSTLDKLSPSAKRYAALIDTFADLHDDAAASETDPLADDLASMLHTAVPWAELPTLTPDETRVLLVHQDEQLNNAQKATWARTLQHLTGRHEPGTITPER